mmetsp:Transcript_23875/g.54352  ORF Transcript_23875/g.54352 Transcript_23875/m.54352 type:complete len:87 (+) Transcript_23875:106-366(+)
MVKTRNSPPTRQCNKVGTAYARIHQVMPNTPQENDKDDFSEEEDNKDGMVHEIDCQQGTKEDSKEDNGDKVGDDGIAAAERDLAPV